jgi:hypothetical protein
MAGSQAQDGDENRGGKTLCCDREHGVDLDVNR